MDTITECISLAIEVNKQTQHTAMVDYHGHVNQFCVVIHEGGWRNDKDSYREYLEYRSNCFSNDSVPLIYEEWTEEAHRVVEFKYIYLDSEGSESQIQEIVRYLKGLQ